MSSPAHIEKRSSLARAEIEKQREAIVAALDRLFEYEVPRRRSQLRLVSPAISALKGRPHWRGIAISFSVRAVATSAIGGDESSCCLLRRHAQTSRPRAFNRTLLASLWSDVGVDE